MIGNYRDNDYDYFYHDTLDNLLDDISDNKFGNNIKKMNIEEKLDFNNDFINNIHFRYYDINCNDFRIYNESSCYLKKINIDMDFDNVINNNFQKNKSNKCNKVIKVNNFKQVIDAKLNINFNSCKCNRNTKNLNKFITIFSGPGNKNTLDEIIGNNLHNKI